MHIILTQPLISYRISGVVVVAQTVCKGKEPRAMRATSLHRWESERDRERQIEGHEGNKKREDEMLGRAIRVRLPRATGCMREYAIVLTLFRM